MSWASLLLWTKINIRILDLVFSIVNIYIYVTLDLSLSDLSSIFGVDKYIIALVSNWRGPTYLHPTLLHSLENNTHLR